MKPLARGSFGESEGCSNGEGCEGGCEDGYEDEPGQGGVAGGGKGF